MKIKLDAGAYMPERAHSVDAGLDIRAPRAVIVHIAIPAGNVGMLKSKSGLNVKHNITSEGVIDAGYTGSIVVKLYNHGKETYAVRKGDKISQLVILPIITPELELVSGLEESERGEKGFGSSGR